MPKDFLSFFESGLAEGEEGEAAHGAGGSSTWCSQHFSPPAALGPSLSTTG